MDDFIRPYAALSMKKAFIEAHLDIIDASLEGLCMSENGENISLTGKNNKECEKFQQLGPFKDTPSHNPDTTSQKQDDVDTVSSMIKMSACPAGPGSTTNIRMQSKIPVLSPNEHDKQSGSSDCLSGNIAGFTFIFC